MRRRFFIHRIFLLRMDFGNESKSGIHGNYSAAPLLDWCFYYGCGSVFDNEKPRRFAAVTDILAALIALAYPATVSGIFPNLSYRVCYFFFSHSMSLFMGILQLQRYKRLSFGDMKSNSIMLAVIAVLAFL